MSQNKVAAGALLVIALVAVGGRMAAFSQPYHHDEYDFVIDANPAYGLEGFIPHPFLSPFVYEKVGAVVGYDHLRIVPVLLSLLTLVLLFFYVRKRFGMVAGVFSAGVYGVSAYGLLGGVQIDIDGAFLPLFTILAFMAYERLVAAKAARDRGFFAALLLLALFLGFSSKLSFILVPLTLFAHYAFARVRSRGALLKRFVIPALALFSLCALVVIVLGDKVGFLRYVDNFTAFSGRDYAQVAFQTVKAALYVSPIALALFLSWRHRALLAPWLMFLAANVAFYFVLFDFTHRTFDRYLLFIMLPLAVIAGVSLAHAFAPTNSKQHTRLICAGAAALGASSLLAELIASLPHRVIPLIPKSAFIESVLSFRFDFLLPMTGGSGPMGFYLPIDALLLLWGLACAMLALFFMLKDRARAYALAAFLGVSFSHTALVASEYLYGVRYGSVPKVASALLEEVRARDTEPAITYNDIGAYDLMEMGKYAARFYPHTEFIEANKKKLAAHEGPFLVIEFPRIAEDSIYGRFFAACAVLASRSDGEITGKLLDCSGAKSVLAGP